MEPNNSRISDKDLHDYAAEHGTIAAVQMLLKQDHGVVSFTDDNNANHLFFSYSTKTETGFENNYAGVEIHGYEGRATVEAGGRLFKNTGNYGYDVTGLQYSENEHMTSGLRYTAATLATARRESDRSSDFHTRFQDLSSANMQGYLAHTPGLNPTNEQNSHNNETLANAALDTYQLRKTPGMNSAQWEAAVSHVTQTTNAVAGVNFGTSETEHTFETVTNITPLSSMGPLESAKFKSLKSNSMRQGMPMGNEGMPGTGTFQINGDDYTWGRLEVGTLPNTPGGGMVMAAEPYAVRQRRLEEKLTVGELGKLQLSIQAGQAEVNHPAQATVNTGHRFYGQNITLGSIEGSRSVTNDIGGASYATVTGVKLAIGYGKEVVQSLQAVPGLENFGAMIQEGFGTPTMNPRAGMDDADKAKIEAKLKLQNLARGKVLDALALTDTGKQFGRDNLIYNPNGDISIVTYMDSFIPASVKGHGLKAGITMIDLALGERDVMGRIEPSSIKLPHLMGEQDRLYYSERFRGQMGAMMGTNATPVEVKEFAIAQKMNALMQGPQKLSATAAYQEVLPDIAALGIIHRVTKSGEFLVPEERANAGRLSSMDLITMHRTGGEGMKKFVMGLIDNGADAESGAIFASLFDRGTSALRPLNMPANTPIQDVLDAMKEQGISPDMAFKIGGHTMPSMRSIGDQGPAYAAVRRVLAAGTEEGAAEAATEAMATIDKVYTQGTSSAKRITEIQTPNLGGRLRYWDAEDEMFTGEGRSQYDIYIGQKEVQRIADNRNVPLSEVEDLIKSGKLMTALGGYPNKGALAMGRLNLANEGSGFEKGIYEELEFSVSSSMLSTLFQRDNDYDFGPQPVGLANVEGHAAAIAGSQEAFNEQAPLALRALEAMGAMVGPGPVAAKKRELIAAGVANPTHMQVLFGSEQHGVTGLEAGVLKDKNGHYVNENVPVKNRGVDESGIPLTTDAGDATHAEGFYHKLGHSQRPEQNDATTSAVVESSESVNAGRRQAPVYGMTKQLGLNFAGMSAEDRKKYNAVARANNPEWEESDMDPYRTGTQTYEGPYQVTVDFHTLPANVKEAYEKLYYSTGMADANGHAEDPIQLAGVLARSLYSLDYINKEALAYSIGGTEHMQEVMDAFKNGKSGKLPGSITKYLADSQFFKIAKMNQAVNFFQDRLEGKFDVLTEAQKGTFDTTVKSHLDFINSNRDLLEGLMASRRGGTPFSLYGTPEITGDIMGRIIAGSLEAAGAEVKGEPGRTPAQVITTKTEGSTIGIEARDDVVDALKRNTSKYYSASAVGALSGMGKYSDSNTVTYLLNELGKGNVKLEWADQKESVGAALEQAVDAFDPNPETNPFGNSVMSRNDIKEWEVAHPGEAPINMDGPIAKDSFSTSWLPDYIKYDTDDANHTITFTDLKASKVENAKKNYAAYQAQQSAYVHRTVNAARDGKAEIDSQGNITYSKDSGKENLFRALTKYAGFTDKRAHEFIADVDNNGASMFKAQLYANNNTLGIHLNDPEHMAEHIIPVDVLSGTALIDVFQKAQDRLGLVARGRDAGGLLAEANRAAAALEGGAEEIDIHGTTYKTTGGEAAADGWSRVKGKIDSQTEKNKQSNATQESVGGGSGNSRDGGTGEARGGAPVGGAPGGSGFSMDDFQQAIIEVIQHMQKNGFGPSGAQQHGGRQAWTNPDGFNQAVHDFMPNGEWTGSVGDFNTLVATGNLGQQQLDFFHNHMRLALGNVAPGEAGGMLANTKAVTTMGAAAWPNTNQNDPNDLAAQAHVSAAQAYANMFKVAGMEPAEYQKFRANQVQEDMRAQWNNLVDRPNVPTETLTSDQAISRNDDAYTKAEAAFNNGLSHRVDLREFPDSATAGHVERAMAHAKAGNPLQAAASMNDARNANDAYAPAGDVETASKLHLQTFDNLFKSLDTLAKHLDNTSASVQGTSKTLNDFKKEHDTAIAQVKNTQDAVSQARISGTLNDASGNLSDEGRQITTIAKSVSAEVRAQWGVGGSKTAEAEDVLSEKDNAKFQEYVSKGGKAGTTSNFAKVTGKLLSGMLAFQIARDLRYTITPMEEAAQKYEQAEQQNVGMMERNGMGFNIRSSGRGMSEVVSANTQYGFGITSSHLMAGITGNGTGGGIGSGPLGGLASIGLPAIGAAGVIGAMAQVGLISEAAAGPVAGLAFAGAAIISGVSSFSGAAKDQIARARNYRISEKYGAIASSSDDIWAHEANLFTAPDDANLVAAYKVGPSYDPGGPEADFGKMSEVERQQFFSGASGYGSRYAEIADQYKIDAPTRDKLIAFTAMRSGERMKMDDAVFHASVEVSSEGGDPLSRMNVSDTIAQHLGDMSAYGGNEIFKSRMGNGRLVPQVQLETQAKKLGVLGGYQAAYTRGLAGYGDADKTGSRYQDNVDTLNAMSTDPSLSTEDLLNHAQAPGVFSQINGGWWGAEAMARNGGPAAQTTFDNLKAFTESGPQTQDVVKESITQSRINDNLTLSRGFKQFGGSLGSRNGTESTEQFQSDTQRQQVQSSIVNNAAIAGFDPARALLLAQMAAPNQVGAFTPAQLAEQAGVSAYTTQSPEMLHAASMFGRNEPLASFATAQARSATAQRLSIQDNMLNRAVAAGVSRSAAIANISAVTPDTGQLYTPEWLSDQAGVDAFNTQSPEMLHAASLMGRVEPISAFSSAQLRSSTAQRLSIGSNMITNAIMNGASPLAAQNQTNSVTPVQPDLFSPAQLSRQEGMAAFQNQSPEMKQMVRELGLAPAIEEGSLFSTPAGHLADIARGMVTSASFFNRDMTAATNQSVSSQYELMQIGMRNDMSRADSADLARKYSPLRTTLRTPEETQSLAGASAFAARTPIQKAMQRYTTPEFQAAVSPEMFDTAQGQAAYDMMTSMSPLAATVGMAAGAISYGSGSAMGLMPAADLSTGGGLFQRSMNGLIRAGAFPSNQQVSNYFAANSQHIAEFTPTGFQGGRDRWASMSQSAAGVSDQNMIINTAQTGGIVGLQELQGAWQTQISNRMEAASIGLSQAGPRVEHEYQKAYAQPFQRMQLDFSKASDFGGTVDTQWMKDNNIPAYDAGRGKFAWARESLAIDTESMMASASQGMTRTGWQIADINRQQYQFGVTSKWQQTDMNVARGRQQTQNQWQMQEFQYQGAQMAVDRRSFHEDTAYNKEVAQLQYGWKMEDADINIKRSTGFQRRQLVKEKGRDTEMFNLEQGHVDVQTKRQEDQFKREDDHFKKQVEHFKTQTKWQDEDFKKEQERFVIQTGWKNEEFNISRSRAQQEMGWAEEALARSMKSMAIRKEQLDAEESQAVAMAAAKDVINKADLDVEQKKFALSQQAVVMTQAEKDKMAELETQIAAMRKDESDRITALGKLQMEYFRLAVEYLHAHGIFTADQKNETPAGEMVKPTPFKANGGRLYSGDIIKEAGPEMVIDTNGGTYALPTRHLTPKPYRSSGDVVRVEASIPINLDGRQIAMAIVPIMVDPVRLAERRRTGRR